MSKLEMHVHTAECDGCATVKARDIVKMYHDHGYDGLVITDHYNVNFQDWLLQCMGRGPDVPHHDLMERWMRGYYEARDEGEKLGFTVLLGAELRFDNCPNEFLIYGLEEDFFYQTPLLNHLSGLQELDSVLPEEACVFMAHPFRNGMVVLFPFPLMGIEVINGRTETIRNDMARMYAEHYGKRMLAGSDFHTPKDFAKGGIITSAEIRTSADLSAALRSGEYTVF